MCERLVAWHGAIVAEFLDEGASRRRRWSNRPEAGRLLESLADRNRGFDAIVVGEYERAFCGRQFDELVPLLRALARPTEGVLRHPHMPMSGRSWLTDGLGSAP
jgi:hypothetical protein